MNYHILDSLDLRAFDNREKDYGVHNYLETLSSLLLPFLLQSYCINRHIKELL